MKAWGSNTRQDHSNVVAASNESYPTFDWSFEFPPREITESFNPEVLFSKQKVVTRRLLFDKKTISTLKEISQTREIENPTRTEVVSAYIWKRFIETTKAKSESPQLFSASLVLDLRNLIASPIEDDCRFGNLVWDGLSDPYSFEGEVVYPELVSKLRGAIKKRDASLVKKLQRGEGLSELKEFNEIIGFWFSSCINFPVYEADFGCNLGKPVWVSPAPMPVPNGALFFSTNCGEGIEAWVRLNEEDAFIFQDDHKTPLTRAKL